MADSDNDCVVVTFEGAEGFQDDSKDVNEVSSSSPLNQRITKMYQQTHNRTAPSSTRKVSKQDRWINKHPLSELQQLGLTVETLHSYYTNDDDLFGQ